MDTGRHGRYVTTVPFTCVVERSGHPVLEQRIDPGRLVRRLEDLAGWLFEAASFPHGAVLMTGGGAAVRPASRWPAATR